MVKLATIYCDGKIYKSTIYGPQVDNNEFSPDSSSLFVSYTHANNLNQNDLQITRL